ncbi:transposase [Colletotrichum incanum]|uniref:Transposase n=1 Tax=Colletotrichum incanum TaxID=1573173 RepID=A0A167E9H1_COLIC|nr:transposase [Colletotrichum incanum]OHW98492.1 hypothetical protein CSPAE12_02814 [Colletotrichum incanum]
MANYLLADCDAPLVDLEAICAWFALVKNTIVKYGIDECDIYNFDETGFMMGQIVSGMVVTSAERRLNTKIVQPGNRAYRLLIVDRHESHHSTDFELYCKANNIVTLCMPAYLLHLLQPLDVGCFGPLKTVYGRQIENKMRRGVTHITKEDFFLAFREAFTGAGIVPLNAESLLLKLDVKFYTLTPLGSLLISPQPWVSRTLNNLIEVTSQLTLTKDRIACHQNSSLTPINNAIDQILKGALGVMHQYTLKEAENKTLREENNTLS